MKKNIYYLVIVLLAFATPAVMLSSCKSKDKAITDAIEARKADMKDLAGLTTSVKDGVVTLSGECKDEESKSMCESTIKAIPGVKEVINNVTVAAPQAAPVTVSADDALMKGVTDAIKDYSGVKADVKDGMITLTGTIKKADLSKLMMSLNTLKPKKINNQLTVQ